MVVAMKNLLANVIQGREIPQKNLFLAIDYF